MAKIRLPTATFWEGFATQGVLLSYGPRVVEVYRRAAEHVDKVLNGAKPADLPVEQPTEFRFVLNRKTAHRLGLTIRRRCCCGRTTLSNDAAPTFVAMMAAPVVKGGRLGAPRAAEAPPAGRNARTIAMLLSALFLLGVTHAGASAAQERHSQQRARMVAEITAMARETGSATGRPSLSEAVMKAMATVPRHRFVPVAYEAVAYENRPLPIGEGQTISQPFLVALMTDLLDPKPEDVVLEVGTGSGYQAAVLAKLVAKVYTIEIVEPLGRQAMQLLEHLGYSNVAARIGDGYNGWPEAAPFNSIIVTAAPAEIPKPLIDQLKPGGRMVIPAGGSYGSQYLVLVEKQKDGTSTTKRTLPVRFVPLTRDRGASER